MKVIVYYMKKLKQYLKLKYTIFFKQEEIKINTKKKQIYVLFGADYCNLGDIAITFAQEKFLNDNFSNKYEIILIKNDDTLKYYLSLKKKVNSDSIITFIGGGNNGDIYDFIDYYRRLIIKNIKKCKIISFPQTIVYSDTYDGRKKLKEFVKYAANNAKFYIMAREKKSFDKYKKYGLKKVFLVPDIVFYLDKLFENKKRNGIGFVLRNDCEKSLSTRFQKILINEIEKIDGDVEFMDTCGYDVKYDMYEEFLNDYLKKISEKKLIITDRLHGMIFCYITGTPCIVFNNNNSKILSTFENWLDNQNFILLSNENDIDLYKKVKQLLNIKEIKKGDIKSKYKDLLEVMK